MTVNLIMGTEGNTSCIYLTVTVSLLTNTLFNDTERILLKENWIGEAQMLLTYFKCVIECDHINITISLCI